MGLDKYREKRDFRRTPEPAGEVHARGDGRLFVVQKHAATRLHYDLRLELDGVLLSWAVPKGPSLDPSVKRLAVRTEDHPIEYGDFEGVIPKGEYGGGTVVAWDRGAWEPVNDPRRGLRKGHLRFRLSGTRLTGEWHLVRTAPDKGGKERWLLFKADDEAADASRDVTDDANSVLTGRNMAEVAGDADRVWDHDGERPTSGSGPGAPDPSGLEGAIPRALPETLRPELATLVTRAPEGAEWLNEIKYDGYRILLRVSGNDARAFSRRGLDWSAKLRALCTAAAGLPVREAWIDGEVVVQDENGRSDFQRLQNDLGAGRTDRLVYFAFDLPYLDGFDLRRVPLMARKDLLERLLASASTRPLHYGRHVAGEGPAFYAEACRLDLEGIVCKRRTSVYRGKRTRDWLKIKCTGRDGFVVGGYTPPEGFRVGFGALLVGWYDGDRLRYAGRVGTGFTDRTLRELTARLEAAQVSASPFSDPVPRSHARRARWVQPELVAEVEYTELTREGILRHPSFKGLREDLEARDVGPPAKPAARRLREDVGSGNGGPPARGKGPPEGAGAGKGGRPAKAASGTRHRGRTVKAATGTRRGARPVVGGVGLSTPDRLLYPGPGLTKRDLAGFYEAHADLILPHLAMRPLTLLRCPEGVTGKCFFQKHARPNIPEAVRRVSVEERQGPAVYLYVDSVEGLVTLVQMNFLEVHPWGARIDRLDRPDRLILDLDPDPDLPWPQVAEAAREIRSLLAELGLESFCKTTGGKGLHVVVPVERRTGWDEAKAFSRAIAHALTRSRPDRYTAVSTKSRRKGRVFVDYLRNASGATTVAAFTPRARPGAPLSVPVGWDELEEVAPDGVTVAGFEDWLAGRARDPWAHFGEVRQSITKPMRRRLGLE